MLAFLRFHFTCPWIFLDNSIYLPSCLWIPFRCCFFFKNLVSMRYFKFSSLVLLFQFYSFGLWCNFSESLFSGTWASMLAGKYIDTKQLFFTFTITKSRRKIWLQIASVQTKYRSLTSISLGCFESSIFSQAGSWTTPQIWCLYTCKNVSWRLPYWSVSIG